VCAVPRCLRRQVDQDQLAEPVEAIPLLVLLGARGQDAQLRVGFGVQQEEDAVEEPQRLPGQVTGEPVDFLIRQAAFAAASDFSAQPLTLTLRPNIITLRRPNVIQVGIMITAWVSWWRTL
jgi:hypothetical protein